MSVEIGQRYISAKGDDPFSEPYCVEVLDIKRSANGEQWVKYAFLHKDINGYWIRGLLDSTSKINTFIELYVLHSEPGEVEKEDPEKEDIFRPITNAIGQLEVQDEKGDL